jgi:hypothetical protein
MKIKVPVYDIPLDGKDCTGAFSYPKALEVWGIRHVDPFHQFSKVIQ